jgi:ribulose 1,5-bisphosphate synthetase/thiazole synthase
MEAAMEPLSRLNPDREAVQMSDSTIDVLIVGGGPTGLTLAIDLVRRGLDAHLPSGARRYSA